MGRTIKFNYQVCIENSLIAHPEGLTLDEMLERSGLGVDRSTLFRHLAQLIEQGRAERIGQARASRYRALSPAPIGADPQAPNSGHQALEQLRTFPERHRPDESPLPSPDAVQQLHRTGHTDPDRVTIVTRECDPLVRKAVRTVVRDWKRFDRLNLEIYLSLMARRELVDGLAVAVEKELAELHEGNLADFGLSHADFASFNPSPERKATGE